jgi:two-component system sensor histidine kinase QseC
MKRSLGSLQAQTTLLVVAVTSAVWISASAAMWLDTRRELDKLLDAHLSQAASFLAAGQGDDDEALEHGRGAVLRTYAPRVAFQVFERSTMRSKSRDAPSEPLIALDSQEGTFASVNVQGTAWRVFSATTDDRDVRIIVAEQVAARNDIALAVLRSTLWPMLLALPLLATAVAFAVRRGLRPMKRLGDTLSARLPTALDPISTEDTPAEMQPVAEALNGLFGRIGDLLDSERRFTADAAHELRTPIAAIRAQAQAALTVGETSARRHALKSTIEGCDRAARLIDQLLFLARLESGITPDFARFDLADLARQVLAEATPSALIKEQHLELDASEPYPVTGSTDLLRALLRNLVDNAIRYSRKGARVTATIKREDGRTVVAIEDSGPGLAEPERLRLGDRFFRGEASRASGSGLGWSIVRSIAELHSVEVAVDRSPALGGLRVRLTFPNG